MATPHHLPKKRGALKSTQNQSLFFERHFRGLQQWGETGRRGVAFGAIIVAKGAQPEAAIFDWPPELSNTLAHLCPWVVDVVVIGGWRGVA